MKKRILIGLFSALGGLVLGLAILRSAGPVDVKQAGAVGNGVADDTAAIRTAIAASDLVFPAGTYRVTSAISVPAGRQLQGQPGAVLTGAIAGPLLRAASGAGIDGLTFDGGGVSFSAKADNVKITNNRFQNIVSANSYSMDGITASGGLSNSTVAANSFVNIYQAGHVGTWSEVCGAIWVWDPVNVAITDNRFDRTCQAIHVTTNQAVSSNLTVLRNTITGSARHNIEIQGKPVNGLVVSNNHISQAQPGINGQMYISVAVGGTGHQILNNTLIGPGQVNAAPHQSAAIEAMGLGFVISGNVAGYFGTAQLIGWSDATWTTRDNIWCGMTDPTPAISIEEGGKPAGADSNNPLTSTCANVTFPPATGALPPGSVLPPTNVSAVNLPNAATPSATVSWLGTGTPKSYMLKAWASGDPSTGTLTAAVAGSPFVFSRTDDGKLLNDGWQYSFAVAAIDAAGVSSPLSAPSTVQVRLAIPVPVVLPTPKQFICDIPFPVVSGPMNCKIP